MEVYSSSLLSFYGRTGALGSSFCHLILIHVHQKGEHDIRLIIQVALQGSGLRPWLISLP